MVYCYFQYVQCREKLPNAQMAVTDPHAPLPGQGRHLLFPLGMASSHPCRVSNENTGTGVTSMWLSLLNPSGTDTAYHQVLKSFKDSEDFIEFHDQKQRERASPVWGGGMETQEITRIIHLSFQREAAIAQDCIAVKATFSSLLSVSSDSASRASLTSE